MTRLSKPVRRETFAPKWGDIVVTLTSAGVEIREKGRRTTYGPVPFGVIMQRGAEMKAAETRRAKLAKKKERLATRGPRGKRAR